MSQLTYIHMTSTILYVLTFIPEMYTVAISSDFASWPQTGQLVLAFFASHLRMHSPRKTCPQRRTQARFEPENKSGSRQIGQSPIADIWVLSAALWFGSADAAEVDGWREPGSLVRLYL